MPTINPPKPPLPPQHPSPQPQTTIVQPGQSSALQAQPAATPAQVPSLSINPLTPQQDTLQPASANDPVNGKLTTHERAVVAANTRWAKAAAERYDWEGSPLDDAKQHLSDLRREIELGGRIIQQRTSTSSLAEVPCAVCNKLIQNGRWMQQRTIRNPDTGLLETVFLCSVGCINTYSTNPGNFSPAKELGPTGLPRPEPPAAVQAELDRRAKEQPKEARVHGTEGMLT